MSFRRIHRSMIRVLPRTLKADFNARFPLVWKIPYHVNLSLRKRQPIVVYRMPQVGSGSVFASLSQHGEFALAVHVIAPDKRHPPASIFYVDNLRGRWIYHHIIQKERKAKFITMIRDPLANAISSLFRRVYGKSGDPSTYNLSHDDLAEKFFGFLEKAGKKRLNWFQENLIPTLGINVFDYPFPTDQGYLRIPHPQHDLLILRAETDNTIKAKAIGELIDDDSFALTAREHVTDDRPYAETYRRFTQKIIVPPEVLDVFYNADQTRHFYSEAEIAAFRATWSGNRDE